LAGDHQAVEGLRGPGAKRQPRRGAYLRAEDLRAPHQRQRRDDPRPLGAEVERQARSRAAGATARRAVSARTVRGHRRGRARRRRFASFVVSSLALVTPKTPLRARLAGAPFALEVLAALLMIVALARPQRVTRMASNDRFGIDIVIALDASGSMAAEDFRPRNRFAVAKDLIGDFISKRQDDRIGIVTFGVRAATRVPITYDRDVAGAILDRAQVGENGDGTAIGHAIATSVNRLRTSRTRSRIIILVTDGVNNAGSIEPMTAAQLASKYGIKIYTI